VIAWGGRDARQLSLFALEETPLPVIEAVDPWGRVIRIAENRYWRRHVTYNHPEMIGLPLEALAAVVAHPDRVAEERRLVYHCGAGPLGGAFRVVAEIAEDGAAEFVTAFPCREGKRLRGTLL
jgi:hypothetical protein